MLGQATGMSLGCPAASAHRCTRSCRCGLAGRQQALTSFMSLLNHTAAVLSFVELLIRTEHLAVMVAGRIAFIRSWVHEAPHEVPPYSPISQHPLFRRAT